jgi:hypothetical protein
MHHIKSRIESLMKAPESTQKEQCVQILARMIQVLEKEAIPFYISKYEKLIREVDQHLRDMNWQK